MFKNNIRKISLTIIAGMMMLTSIPFSALAKEGTHESNMKLSLVNDEEIFVGEEFEVKVENDNTVDKTLIELPEGIVFGDNSHDENITYNGALVAVLSGSERILKLKGQNQGDFKLEYTNSIGDESNYLKLQIKEQEDHKDSSEIMDEVETEENIDENLPIIEPDKRENNIEPEESKDDRTPETMSTHSNGSVDVTIEDHVDGAGFNYGKIYSAKIKVDFGGNGTNNRLSLRLAEGFRYFEYGTINTPKNSAEVRLESDSELYNAITKVNSAQVSNKSQNINGRVEYEFKDNTGIVELEVRFTIDETLFYGAKSKDKFNYVFKIDAEKNNQPLGNEILINDGIVSTRTWGLHCSACNNISVLEGDTSEVVMGGPYLNYGNDGQKTNFYVESAKYEMYYPKDTKLVGVANPNNKEENYTDYPSENKAVFDMSEQILTSGEFAYSPKVTYDHLEVGNYKLVGNNTITMIAYDGTEIKLQATTANQTLVIVADAPNNFTIYSQTVRAKYSEIVPNYDSSLYRFELQTDNVKAKTNQVLEFEFGDNQEVRLVSFPNGVSGVPTVKYQTNYKNSYVTATGVGKLPYIVDGYAAISSLSENLADDEYFTKVHVFIAEMPKDFKHNDTSSRFDVQGKNGVYGRITNDASAINAKLTNYALDEEGNIDESTRKTVSLDAQRATGRYYVGSSISTASVVVNAGGSAPVRHTISTTNSNPYSALGKVDPEIYLLMPDGIVISDITAKYVNGQSVPFTYTGPYTTTTGAKYMKIKLETRQGRDYLNNQNFVDSGIYVDYKVNASASANGVYSWDDIGFVGLENGVIRQSWTSAKYDKHNILGEGTTTENIATVANSPTQLVIQNTAGLKVDSYIIPDGGVRQPEYVEGDKDTAVAFTPDSSGKYTISVFNNNTSSSGEIYAFAPIPKENVNFGSQIQSDKFPFNMKIEGTPEVRVYNQNGDRVPERESQFKIEYAQATKDNWKEKPVEGNPSSIYGPSRDELLSTMIRISSKNGLNAYERAEIIINYSIDEDSNDIDPSKLDKILDFSPYYETPIGGTSATKVGIILQVGQIEGTVFVDDNFNGKFDSGELTLANVPVKLLDINGSEVKSIYTDSNGKFKFENLSAETYTIDFNGVTTNQYPQFTNKTTNGSVINNVGTNKGKFSVSPVEEASKSVLVGVIEYSGENNFKDNILLPEMKLVEPHPDAGNTPHLDSKRDAVLSFDPTGIKDFVDGNISYVSEDPELVKVTKVDNYNIKVEALRKSPEIVGTEKTNIVVTFTDIYGNKTTEKFEVSVRANDRPIITVTGAPFELKKGDTYSVASDGGLSLSDPQQPELDSSDIVPDFKGQQLNEVGIYTIELNFTDADGNVAETVERKIVVWDDENPVVDGHLLRYNESYAIKLANFPKELDDKVREAYDIDHGNLSITNIETGANVPARFDFTNYQFENGYGPQSYTFSFDGKDAEVTRTITVHVSDNPVDAGEYYLLAETAYISKTKAKEIKSTLGAEAVGLTNARAKAKVGGTETALDYVSVDPAFSETPGTYTVTFKHSVTNKTTTADIVVMDFDDVVQVGEYVIGANHFLIGKDDVNSGNLNLAERANAKVFHVNDLNNNLGAVTTSTLDADVTTQQPVEFTGKAGMPADLKISVDATVKGDTVINGEDYVMVIDPKITIQKNEAEQYIAAGAGTSNPIIEKAHAKAYLKTNLATEGTVTYKSGTFKADESGTATFAVVEDPEAADVTIPVTVRTEYNKPEITIESAHKVVKLPLNDTDFNDNQGYKTGVTADDIDNPSNLLTFDNGKLTASPQTIDTSKPGVYTIEYNTKDKNNLEADPVYKIVVVGDDIIKVGDYFIYANNVVKEVKDFKTLDEAATKDLIVNSAEAYAIHSVTGPKEDVVVSDLKNFDAKAGSYTVELKVKGIDTTDFETIEVVLTDGKVVKGDKYYISAKDVTGGLALARKILEVPNDNTELFKVMDVKVTPIHGNEVYDMTKVTVANRINEVKEQDWPMTFTADKDPAANIGKQLTITKDENGGIENDFYLGASPFVIGQENVQAGITMADFVKYSDVNGYRVSTEDGATIEVKAGTELDGSLGATTITFKVAGQNREETVDVLVVEGKSVVANNYVLTGKDFTITGKEAKELYENQGVTAKDSILLDHADSHLNSYKRYTVEEAGTVVVHDRSEIKNEEKNGGYNTKYRVKDGANTLATPELSLKVNVDMGTEPTLTADEYSTLPLGTEYNHADANIGGTAPNNTKTNIELSDLDLNLVEGTVDKDKVGVYPLTYHFTDEYGISVSVKHLVIVTDDSVVVTDKHIIYAQNVLLKVEQIRTGAEANIKAASKPYAYVIETGEKVKDEDISILRGNVEAKPGTYQSEVKVAGDDKTKKIIVGVTEGDIIEGENHYLLTGNGTTIGKSHAQRIIDDKNSHNTLLIDTMNVIAIHKTQTTRVPNSKIIVTNNITEAKKQERDITFTVDGDALATDELKLIVTDDNDVNEKDGIFIAANPFVVGRNNVAKMNLDKDEYVKYAGAYGWDSKNNNAAIDVVAESNLNPDPTVDQNQEMKFTVTKDGVSVSVTVKVLIVSGTTVLGEDYVIAGQDFEISGAQAKKLQENPVDAQLDAELIAHPKSALQAFKKYSLENAGDIIVIDRSNITNAETDEGYKTMFGVDGDSRAKIELKVKVAMGVPPKLVTRTSYELQVGTSFDPSLAFVSGEATNDGKNSLQYSDLNPDLFEGLDELEANKNNVGVYKVVYKYEDSAGQVAEDYTLVYVNDNSIQLTDKHLIFGENVTLKPSEVNATVADTIKTRSNAYAYVLDTGIKVDPLNITINATGVKAEEGIYDALIMVHGDPVGKRIKVLVAEDSKTVGDYTVSAYNTKISKAEAEESNAVISETVIRKSRAMGVHSTSLTPLEVFAEHSIDLSKTKHDVEYYVNKLETTTKAVSIIKEVEIVTDKYIDNEKDLYISGNGFIVQKDEVAGLTDEQYADLAGVKVKHETNQLDTFTSYVIGNKLDPNRTDVQKIKFGVKRGNQELNKPFIEVDALVIDGVVVIGDTHTLVGENFEITGSQAKLVKDDIDGTHDNILIDGGKVTSYLNGTTIENGTVVVHDKSDVDTDEDTYSVFYRVEDDNNNISTKPTLELDVDVKLSAKPEIDVDSNSSINITNNETFDAESKFNGGTDHSTNTPISYGDAGLKVTVDGVDIDSVVFDTIGIYKVVYTYTDSSEQTVSATHTLAVTDGSIVEDKGYYIFGQNAVITLEDLNTLSAADLDTLVYGQVKPYAIKVADGTDVSADRISLVGLNSIPKKVGQYTLTVAIDDEATLKTVELHVTNGDITKKGSYTLITNDTYVTQVEAGLSKAALDELIIKRSGTKAVHDTLNTLGTITATHSINTTVGKQDVTYSVDEVAEGLSKPAHVTVKDSEQITEDQDVYLEGHGFVVSKDSVKAFNDDTTFAKYIEAAGANAWSDFVADEDLVIKVVASSKLKANPGIQTVQYYVEGYPQTQMAIKVRVTDGNVVVGDKFSISAKNTTVSAAIAQNILDGSDDQSNIIFGDQYAKVEVFDNKTLDLVTTENVDFDKNDLATVGKTYQVSYTVVNDPSATITRDVTVTQGETPDFTVPKYVKVTLNDPTSYNPVTGVVIKDNNKNQVLTPVLTTDKAFFEDPDNKTEGLMFVDVDAIEFDKPGIYIIEFLAMDSNFNVVRAEQAVEVSKDALPTVNNYSIYAENVVLDYNTHIANKTDNEIIQTILDKAHGYAVHTENLTTHAITIEKLESSFIKDEAVNTVEVHVVGDKDAKTDITVTITRGVIDEKEDYTISYSDAYLTVSELESLTPTQIKEEVIKRAHATITPKLGQDALKVDYQETVDAVAGDYKVKYHLLGDQSVIADDFANVHVKDSDVIEDLGDYVMTANNFPIGIKDIDATTMGQFAKLANLVIEHKVTKVKVSPTSMTKPEKQVGLQETTFTYTEGSYTNSIEVMADVMDGNVVTKNKYSIKAEPVEMLSVEDALVIVEEIEQGNFTTIAGLANVEAFETRSKDTADYVMVADSSTIEAVEGDYEIYFKVDTTEEDVRIRVAVHVDAGEAPTLTVEPYVELGMGLTDYDRKTAITKAYDNNKLADIPLSEVDVDGDVNLDEPGVYPVTFTVKDANNNVETASTTVLVNDGSYEIIDDKYMFKAKSFVINKDDVYKGNAANTQLKELAEVSAYNFVDKVAINDTDILVDNNGGYKATVGDYPVTFKIRTTNVTKSIVAKVTEEDIKNGKLYSLTGKDLIIGQAAAKAIADGQDIVDLMGVEVHKRVPSAINSGITVDNFNEFSETPGTYEMTFSVTEEPETKDTYTLEVVDGDHVVTDGIYTLIANDFYVGLEDLEDLDYATPEKLIELSKAYAIRKIGDQTDIVPAYWVSGPRKEIGLREVVFAVAEKRTLTMPVTATVIDGRVIESDNFYINALSTTRPISDLKLVQSGQKDIQDIMSVRVIDKATGLPVANMAETVTNMDDLEAKAATYPIEFKFTDGGKDYSIKPKLTLSIGTPPEIEITKVQNVDLDNPSYNPELGLVMSDAEDDNNNLAPALEAIYDATSVEEAIANKKVGVYTVKYTTVDFDGNTSAPAYQTVVVNDGSIEVGDDYALEAHNFSINVNDVVANSDAHLREKTGAKAYKLGANNVLGTVEFTTNYKAEVGEYDVNMKVTQDPSIDGKVVAKVVKDKVKETENYTISATNAFLGLEDAASVNETMLIAAANAKAENKRLGNAVDVELVSHNVTAVAGNNYEAIFKVKDIAVADEDTTIKVKVTVLGSKYVITDKQYILAADDFYVGEKDIANGITNDEYVGLSRAYAFDRYDVNTEYDVKMDATTAPVNVDRQVRYYIDQHNTTDVEVTAHVLAGEVIQGDDYYIKAEPITIFVSEAVKVLNGDLDIITLTSAMSESLDGTLTGKVLVKENKIKAEDGTYDVTFVVDEDPTAEITIKVRVDKGLDTVLTVPTHTEINVHDAFDEMAGVSAIDDRDGDITSKVVVTGDYDVNKVGVYELTYTVVDSDLNTSVEKTYLVVNDGSIIVKDGYILSAENYMINKDVMDATNTEIITKTKAHAYKIADNKEVDVIVTNNGGYTNKVGDYAITLAVEEKASVNTSVKATVVKGAISESDDYYLSANNITIGLEDARTINDTDIVKRADAKAVHKTLGTAGTVVVSDKTLTPTAGDYSVTYIVTEDNTSGLTRTITVLDKDIVIEEDDFVIYADNFMVGDKFVKEMTKKDLVALANAGAYNKLKPTEELPVTQVEDIITDLGKHTVTFAMVDDANVKIQVTKTIFQDVMYYIEANDAEIEIGNLTKAINNGRLESTVLSLTNAKGYRVETDGTKVEMPVFVLNKDDFLNAKVNTTKSVQLSLVDPQTKDAITSRTVDTETHRLEEANVNVNIKVNANKKDQDGGDDNGGSGGTKDPSTGIRLYSTVFSMILALASLLLVILMKRKRKEA